MLLTKLKMVTVLPPALMLLMVGAGMFTYHTVASPPGEPNRKVEKPEWGEEINGVQARIRTVKYNSYLRGRDAVWTRWGVDETPKFALDLRNQAKKTYSNVRVESYCQVEFDGEWYVSAGSHAIDSKAESLEAGKQFDMWVTGFLDGRWVRKDDKEVKLKIAPGKHTVRVAYGDPVSKNPRPISNLIEIEVLKEMRWGDAIEGVQARLGPDKVEWQAGEPPIFGYDLRNRGEKTFSNFRAAAYCEIEFDGKWYVYAPLPPAFSGPPTSLEPREQVDDWVRMAVDGDWIDKTANRKPGDPIGYQVRLKITPGKHTVRVAFPLSDKVRPISQPVEIVVQKADALAKPREQKN